MVCGDLAPVRKMKCPTAPKAIQMINNIKMTLITLGRFQEMTFSSTWALSRQIWFRRLVSIALNLAKLSSMGLAGLR